MNRNYIHPADQLVLYMQRIYDKGLTTTSGGNLSVMDEDGNIWITPAAIDKGALTRDDIVCVKADGTTVGRHRPSSELPFHRAVYRMRPDLKAVLHAHPPALVSFSVARKLPNLDLLPAARAICPEMRIAAYAVPGSELLGRNISRQFEDHCNLVLLENHGICIGAKDLYTAFLQFETLEYVAKLEILANRIGKPKAISEQGNTDRALFEKQELSAQDSDAARELISLIRRGHRLGLFSIAQVSYSVRLPDESFLITPSGMDPADTREDELIRINACGNDFPGFAALHAMIYRQHPEINSVLMARPVHAMAFAVTDAEFDTRVIPESYVLLRDVQRMKFGARERNPEEAAACFSEITPAAIMEHDCVIVTGNSALQAFDRLEVMELTARAIMDTGLIGRIVDITEDEIEDIKAAFHLKG